jgi:hypothetical protein
MRRQHGTGRIYLKWGAFYGRWRTLDGRYVNRRLGKIRERGSQEGISRREGERMLRRLMETETQPRVAIDVRARTVDEVAGELRGRLAIEGARLSQRRRSSSTPRSTVTRARPRRPMSPTTSSSEYWRTSSPRARMCGIAEGARGEVIDGRVAFQTENGR